jgi:putative transposase
MKTKPESNNNSTAIKEISTKLVNKLLAKADPQGIFAKDGLFNQLKKQIVEKILESELEHELGYIKHSKEPKEGENRRNGSYDKALLDEHGQKITIEVPRDREGRFTPQLVPKGLSRFNRFDDKVISLYVRGMTMNEI